MKLYQVSFMPRTGHTAICHWLSRQPGKPVFSMSREVINAEGRVTSANGDWRKFDYGIMQTWPSGGNLNIANVTEPGIEPHVIVVVRSFENWLASTLYNPPGGCVLPGAHTWRELAATLLFADGIVNIIYDRWFVSKEYRRKITERLGMPFSDDGLMRMFERSSFDSMDEYRFRAQDMDVLNRWKRIENEPVYIVFKDMFAELRSLIAPFFKEDISEADEAEIRRHARVNYAHLVQGVKGQRMMDLPPQTAMSQEKARWVYDLHLAQMALKRMENDPKVEQSKKDVLTQDIACWKSKIG